MVEGPLEGIGEHLAGVFIDAFIEQGGEMAGTDIVSEVLDFLLPGDPFTGNGNGKRRRRRKMLTKGDMGDLAFINATMGPKAAKEALAIRLANL